MRRERGAVKAIGSSSAGRTLRSNPRWKGEREEKSPAAECPWPKGRTPHVQTTRSRALYISWHQEMQNCAIWYPGQLWFQTDMGEGGQQQS